MEGTDVLAVDNNPAQSATAGSDFVELIELAINFLISVPGAQIL